MPIAKKKPTTVVKKKTVAPKKAGSASAATDASKDAQKKVKLFQPIRGMKDILPKDDWYWLRVFDVVRNMTRAYGYRYSEPPVLESAQLFVKSIGKGTDVIDKEMYVFDDQEANKLALRPEFTAGVARSYISNGLLNNAQPVKLWMLGPLFRHDRPQAGRYRQFHQFNCEVIGEKDPVIDAELIIMAYNVVRDLGISPEVHINSIGSLEDRQNYIIELQGYLRSKKSYLSEESKKRMLKNPLRILDSKEEQDQEVIAEAPQIIDWLSAESKDFFMKVLEYLDELQIPYVLKPTLVRGLDYYSDTVFEIYNEKTEQGTQSALGGGGRYDGLLEQLGAREMTPASGFALGIERVISAMKELDQQEGAPNTKRDTMQNTIFFAQLGGQGRRRALLLIEELRRAGIMVGSSLSKGSLKGQLEMANKQGATHCIILGQKEVQDGTVIIRDMSSGVQEIIDQKRLEKHLQKLLQSHI